MRKKKTLYILMLKFVHMLNVKMGWCCFELAFLVVLSFYNH